MSQEYQYDINLDVKYQPLEKIDIPAIVDACKEKWFNQTLTQVNDSVVRIGIVHGEFHWHKHDDDDEFFFVVDGKLIIQLEEDQEIELNPGQGVTIPKGVMHCPKAPVKTTILMVETSSIQPTGD